MVLPLQGTLRHPRAALTTVAQTLEAQTHAAPTPVGQTPAEMEAAGKSHPGEPTLFAWA